MSAPPGPIATVVAGLLWPDDPTTRTAILLLLGLAALAFVSVYGPLVVRLVRVGQLRRAVQACFDDESSNAIQRQEVTNAFAESPLAGQWSEFVRRWHNAIAADPIQDASLPELSRAPVRLTDVLEEYPILPAGARRSLLPALPAIFLAAGLLGAFAGLVLALPDIAVSLDSGSLDAAARSHQIARLLDHLGTTLRVGLWGLLLSLAAAVGGRLMEGRADLLGAELDGWVQLAYGAISTGELATRTAHEQRAGLARLQEDVSELLRQAVGRPRPLRSAAPSPASPGAATAPETLEPGLNALGERLGERLDRAVSAQIAGLRESLEAALEGLAASDRAPDAAPGDLAVAVEHLVKGAESQSAASHSLTQTARVLSAAATELRSGLDELAGTVTEMRESSAALAQSSQRADADQQATSRVAGALADAFARAEALTQQQQDRLEAGLREVREVIAAVSERLRDGLQNAVADAVAPGQEAARQSGPPPAPDARPLEHPPAEAILPDEKDEEEGLLVLDEEPGVAPGAAAPAAPEAAAPAPRPAPPSEADTIPYMKAPSPKAPGSERMYSQGEHRAARVTEPGRPSSHAAPSGGGTLSGLLRPTHHSTAPWDEPDPPLPDPGDKVDPAATLRLRPWDDPRAGDGSQGAASEPPDAADPEPQGDTDASPRSRGFFRRQK